jgi:hypothetical protein
MAPIPLTDTQADLVYAATKVLPPDSQEAFLRSLANTLAGSREISDGQLWRVIREAQKKFWRPPPQSERPTQSRRRAGSAIL